MSRIVIALGGNALGDNAAEQREKIREACPSLIGLIAQGHEIIVSHGNGPQVGMINTAFDIACGQSEKIPHMDLMECAAMSQGYICLLYTSIMEMNCQVSGGSWLVTEDKDCLLYTSKSQRLFRQGSEFLGRDRV